MPVRLKLSFLPRLGLALLGGILMGITPAPVEAWFLAWVALIPLWLFVTNATQEKHPYRSAILYAVAWGLGYHGLALFWITGVHPMTWMGVPWLASLAIALFCWGFITLLGIIIVATWSVILVGIDRYFLTSHLSLKIALRLLVGVAVWCGLEALLALGNLNWTFLGYTQSPHNLVILHLGQVSGALTVTAVIVAVNGLFAEGIRLLFVKPSLAKVTIGCSLGLLILSHLIGFGLYTRPLSQDPNEALKIGIIQGNIPNEIKLSQMGWRKALEGYTEGYLTLSKEGVDAVLTPETSLPFTWNVNPEQFNSLQRAFYDAVLDQNIPVWIGGFSQDGKDFSNSLFTMTGEGEIVDYYSKVKLVPLGEYIPFEQTLGRFIEKLSPLDARLIAGDNSQILNTPFGEAIVGICYDSAFPELFRRQAAKGGEFILVSSNDAHYHPSMSRQHHAQDVMRAIETNRWAARAVNTGYSAIVDPHGHTKWISDLNTYQLHAETIYKQQNKTLYVRWGNWLLPTLFVLTGMGLFITYSSSQ